MRVQDEILEKYLPAHTKPDHLNGNCFVSLVGFQFRDLEAAGIKVPLYSDFEEIRLRLYVKRFDGAKWRKGVDSIAEIVDKVVLKLLANTVLSEDYL